MNQDNKLVEGCKSGDPNAQIEVYRKYYRPIFNTCLRIICNHADAEDLMQNSFIDAFGKIKTYKGHGNFEGWLKKIAVNNCLDFLNKKKQIEKPTETLPDIPEPSGNQEDEFIEFQVEMIKNAMTKLHIDYRIVLSLYLFEGYDHEEIGQILKINQQNVRTRISRAKHSLLGIIKMQMTGTKSTVHLERN